MSYDVGQSQYWGGSSDPAKSDTSGFQSSAPVPLNAPVHLSGRSYRAGASTVVTPSNMMEQIDQGAKTSVKPSSLSLNPGLGAANGSAEMSSADASPGNAAQDGIKSTKASLASASKDAMGSPEAAQLQQLTQSLEPFNQQVGQADKVTKQSTTISQTASAQEKSGGLLHKTGAVMEKTGTALSTAGQAMMAAGKAMLSNPFTAIAGAALIAAGMAMKIAGTAMKVAGKVMKASGKALQKIAKALAKVAKTLMKVVKKIVDKLKKILGTISQKIQAILARLRGKKTGKMVNKPDSQPIATSSNKAKQSDINNTANGKPEGTPDEGGSWRDTAKELGVDLALSQGISMMTSKSGDDAAATGAQAVFGTSSTFGNQAVSLDGSRMRSNFSHPFSSANSVIQPPASTEHSAIFQPFTPQFI